MFLKKKFMKCFKIFYFLLFFFPIFKTFSLFMYNLYEPNYHSVYYGALFIPINKFFLTDLTFTPSIISNLSDESSIVLTQLVYNPVFDFTLELTLVAFIGEDDREYTFIGNEFYIQLETRLIF